MVISTFSVQAQADPVAILKRATEAHGGAELLTKYKAGTYTLSGTMVLPTGEVGYSSDVVYEAPDKYSLTLILEMKPNKVTLAQVVNGDKIRVTMDGRPQAVSAALKAEAKAAAAMQEITQLAPLLDPARYTLKSQPESTFRGQPAAVVVVAPKAGKELTLYFSTKDGTLIGTRRQGLDATEKAVAEETTLTGYQKIQGVLIPMNVEVTHDGKKFTTMKYSAAKLMESADSKLFQID
jgi:hypothetical protein